MSERGNTTARDLMIDSFWRIDERQTIRDAIRFLLAGGESPPVVVALDSSDAFVGLLTPRLLLRGLLADWTPEDSSNEESRWRESLFDRVEDHLDDPVADILVREIQVLKPEDRLLRMMELTSDQRLEYVPVVEGARVIGVLPIVEVFRAAAALALSPRQDGEDCA